MGMSSTLNPCGNGAPIVDKLLGEAYETVRFVATQIEYVKHVSLHMEQVYRVHGSIDAIDALSENIAKIDALYAELNSVIDVFESLADLKAIAVKLPQLQVIFNELAKLTAVYTDLPNIRDVSANLSIIQTIHTNLAALTAVYNDLNNIVAVRGKLTQIDSVANNLAAVTAVHTNMTALLAINSKLTDLLYVRNNMDTFLDELDTLTSLDSRVSAVESGKQASSPNLSELSSVNPGTTGKTILAAEAVADVMTTLGAFSSAKVIDDDIFGSPAADTVPSTKSTKAYADKKAPLSAILTGVATYDWPSVSAGATASTTVTVTGATLGDIVIGKSLSVALPAGVIMDASVTATNTVTLTIVNHTAAAVDLASATHRVVVLKKATWGLTS